MAITRILLSEHKAPLFFEKFSKKNPQLPTPTFTYPTQPPSCEKHPSPPAACPQCLSACARGWSASGTDSPKPDSSGLSGWGDTAPRAPPLSAPPPADAAPPPPGLRVLRWPEPPPAPWPCSPQSVHQERRRKQEILCAWKGKWIFNTLKVWKRFNSTADWAGLPSKHRVRSQKWNSTHLTSHIRL